MVARGRRWQRFPFGLLRVQNRYIGLWDLPVQHQNYQTKYLGGPAFESQGSERLQWLNSHGTTRFFPGYDSIIVVCNPITDELVNLPKGNFEDYVIVSGLGFGPNLGGYKVIKMSVWPQYDDDPLVVLSVYVHVLGIDSWRKLNIPEVRLRLRYLNGPCF